MLAESKLKTLLDLTNTLSKEEMIWINGYLSGLLSQGTEAKEAVAVKNTVNKITIAYGTETGNAKKVATDFASKAKKSGIATKLVSLDQYRLNDLSKEEYFLTIISTQGDGEPPAAAKKFYDHIHQNGFLLDKLKYSVLALGDTAYPLFCKAGEDVDSQLQNLGGKRILPLQKCDTDFEEDAHKWFVSVLKSLSSAEGAAASAPVTTKKHSGKKTLTGTVLSSINLNDVGSNKETCHIEIGAEALDYQPGDAIGIVPENPAAMVHAILALTKVDGSKKVEHKDEAVSIVHLLQKKLSIIHLPERVVAKYAALVQQDIPATRIDLLDLLKIYPLKDAEQFDELLTILEPITPRLYSISSSPEAHSGEVHITVAKDRFFINEELKHGLCSGFLAQLKTDTSIEFYVHRNNQFRLPAEDKDVIMIGPGTGMAPFRSFLAERDATTASGRNWLFFGDQHFTTDFLYQTEIQNWFNTGVLTKVDVAFSRDQAEKIYVQHKMLKQGAAFFEWLEAGAYVYVCGAKDPMSMDVEKALLQIIEQFGKTTEAEARSYLDKLMEEGRYLKDVY